MMVLRRFNLKLFGHRLDFENAEHTLAISVGDGISAGHDTKDGGQDLCRCEWQRPGMYRSNLIGEDPPLEPERT